MRSNQGETGDKHPDLAEKNLLLATERILLMFLR